MKLFLKLLNIIFPLILGVVVVLVTTKDSKAKYIWIGLLVLLAIVLGTIGIFLKKRYPN